MMGLRYRYGENSENFKDVDKSLVRAAILHSPFAVEDKDRPEEGIGVLGLDFLAGLAEGGRPVLVGLEVAVERGHVGHRLPGGQEPKAQQHALGPGVLIRFSSSQLFESPRKSPG